MHTLYIGASKIFGGSDMTRSRKPFPIENLPVLVSSFIGRAQDSIDVANLLATSRLVTLTGAGGCGKTRLAVHVARIVADRYADGVWYCPLGPLSDPVLVPHAVTAAIGLSEQPGRPVLDTLVENLRSIDGLLVLDNCEHLIDACAELATAVLQACPQLCILATSREPLHVEGEFVWTVPSLAVPTSTIPVSRLQQFDAVRLFSDRATAASTAFQLTSQNSASVAHICQRLDGIPLAIELAAARMTILSADQIAVRLDDAMRLLTEGKRGAPPRHQTLRATLDWSYTLLSTKEQILCRRLSVFVGGFSLDAADSICARMDGSAKDIHRDEVFHLLAHLVDKSLVVASLQPDAENTTRYRLLETVRQYGHEQILRTGEFPELQQRHAEYYLSLAESEWPSMVGAQQADWLAQMEAEHANLRSALAWSRSADGGPEHGLRLAAALCWFWWTHGYHSEAQQWLEQTLSRSSQIRTRTRAQALCWAGILAVGAQDHFGQAATLLEDSLALSQELHDRGEVSWSLVNLARVAEFDGEATRAAQLAEQGVSVSRALGHPWYIAQALERLGEVVRLQGDYTRAQALYEESLTLSLERDDKRNVAVVLHNLGHVKLQREDLQGAATYFVDSLNLAQEIGDRRRILMCLEGVASTAARANYFERAALLCGAAQTLRTRLGIPFEAADLAIYRHSVAKIRANLGEAVSGKKWTEGELIDQAEAIRQAQDLCSHVTSSHLQSSRAPARRNKRHIRQEFGGLTVREREVALLIMQGKTNREIATLLVISERTVDKHVGQTLAKLGFHTRAQVAAWAVEQRLSETS